MKKDTSKLPDFIVVDDLDDQTPPPVDFEKWFNYYFPTYGKGYIEVKPWGSQAYGENKKAAK